MSLLLKTGAPGKRTLQRVLILPPSSPKLQPYRKRGWCKLIMMCGSVILESWGTGLCKPHLTWWNGRRNQRQGAFGTFGSVCVMLLCLTWNRGMTSLQRTFQPYFEIFDYYPSYFSIQSQPPFPSLLDHLYHVLPMFLLWLLLFLPSRFLFFFFYFTYFIKFLSSYITYKCPSVAPPACNRD